MFPLFTATTRPHRKTRRSSVELHVCLSVCLSVCVSVGHDSEPYKNGSSYRDAGWRIDSSGPKEPRVRCGSKSPTGKEQFLGGGCPAHLKHCQSLLRCTKQKIDNGISATDVADCVATDWPVSH